VEAGQLVNPGQRVATLIDPTSLEAAFLLLEAGIASLGLGRCVRVRPVANLALERYATLGIINPQVDENGLLCVCARLPPVPRGRLSGHEPRHHARAVDAPGGAGPQVGGSPV